MTNLLQKIAIGFACLAFTLATATASEPVAPLEDSTDSRPAVDGVNGKLTVGYSFDQADMKWGSGSFAIPLSERVGLQVDAIAAEADADILGQVPFFGVGMHLFWRDPSRALLGVYGHTIHVAEFGGLDSHFAALEGELYWDRITLESVVGMSSGDFLDPEFQSHATVAYYATENLRLNVGHAYAYRDHKFKVGGEWAFNGNAGTSVSMIASGVLHDHGETRATLGLRFYLGQKDKSLIRRHREDDPAYSGMQVSELWAAIQATGELDTVIHNARAFYGPF